MPNHNAEEQATTSKKRKRAAVPKRVDDRPESPQASNQSSAVFAQSVRATVCLNPCPRPARRRHADRIGAPRQPGTCQLSGGHRPLRRRYDRRRRSRARRQAGQKAFPAAVHESVSGQSGHGRGSLESARAGPRRSRRRAGDRPGRRGRDHAGYPHQGRDGGGCAPGPGQVGRVQPRAGCRNEPGSWIAAGTPAVGSLQRTA